MTIDELIGQVGARYLQIKLGEADDSDDTARYLIDRLSKRHTAAIAKAVLADSTLIEQIEIKLPAHFMQGQELPDLILTEERATYYRNAQCSKAARLLATTGDDEAQSLNHLTPIGIAELMGTPELWVDVASTEANLSEGDRKWWEKALKGLFELNICSLEQAAQYTLQTRNAIIDDGHPIVHALDEALPALQIPRGTGDFNGIRENYRGHAAQWRRRYESAHRKYACYLQKYTPSQTLLDEEELRDAFNKVKDAIPENYHPLIAVFIEAPPGWNDQAHALAECKWEIVGQPLFEGLKPEKKGVGELTFAFYDEREPELLTESEQDYLQRLKNRGKLPKNSDEEDRQFYEDHRNELKEDRKLKSLWDQFIFKTALETDDFLVGLIQCIERLIGGKDACGEIRMTIRCDRRSNKDFRDLNVEAGLYFATRYHGLPKLFGPKVSWARGFEQLFSFPKLVETWQGESRKPSNSTAKAARQIKFTVELESDLMSGNTEKYANQLIWEFNLSSLTTQFHSDLKRLVEHPLVFCRTTREPISTKGEFQPLDLSNVKSFDAAYGRERGSFVSIYKEDNDIAKTWLKNLEEAKQQHLLTDEDVQQIRSKFEIFRESYEAAISGFMKRGLACKELLKQLSDYAGLLETLYRLASGDRNRRLLLNPLMEIGVVAVEGGKPATVVAPWHPLRLAAMKVKAEQMTELLHRLFAAEDVTFGNTERFFFREIEEALVHPYYPEVVLGWDGVEPKLLSLTDTVGDYSLYEHPVATNEANNGTNDNPEEAANLVTDLVDRYLQLQPHAQTNLSVALYNCDSVRLPQAVVEKIRKQYEENEDVLCQIVLRHRNKVTLRRLYEQIIESSGEEVDAFSTSEATKDFMARLRINIIADQVLQPDEPDGCPMDIVFSQDVIARHAGIEWYHEDARPVDLLKLFPSQWSRRRSAATDDMKSVVYLCCPVQSRAGWAYLTAIATVLKGDWDKNEARRLLPTRQLDFQKQEMTSIFEETHNLGNWVINYDELLDRRQVENQDARVIRYKQSVTQGRNIIISSKADLNFLENMLIRRLKTLDLDLEKDDYQHLAEKFCGDANRISGDIVLRAAKRGRNASELIGVVLSRFLILHELSDNDYFGWYFLDDYAEWLGLREGRIADILALSPSHAQDGKLRLDIVVSEAKYINASNLPAKKKESQRQLQDTFKRINDTIFGQPERLDRPILLARLSDLVLDGIQLPASANINLSNWRRSIRGGACEIFLRGYSHVFVSDPPDASECSELISVANCEGAYQEVFSHAKVQKLVLSYMKDTDPILIRRDEVGEEIWRTKTYREPLGTTRTIEKSLRSAGFREVQSEAEKVECNELEPEAESVIEVADLSDTSNSEDKDENQNQNDDIQHLPISESWPYKGIARFLAEYQGNEVETQDTEHWLVETARQCRGALQQFQLQAKLVDSILTPNAALLKFQGSANLTVEQVLKRRSEFLTTYGLNLISVRPEPQKVAISLARPERRILHLPQIWRNWDKDVPNHDRSDCNRGNQKLLIGLKEEDSSLLFLSPRENAPHTLIAGSTGSGKSVLMQNIILGIAATNTPEQAHIVLVDPKMGVDYFAFENLPHLQGGVIDDQETAIEHLNRLVAEMDRRYTVLRQNRVSDIFDLNAKPTATERLPVLWIIHDEFAEWMMTEEYKSAITSVVSRLGVKARAAGIFLVFGAQRPDQHVMPMQLRANLGNRLILQVDSEGTSEIALGEPGAEHLLGKGHLAAKLIGESAIITAQVPFVSQEELGEIVERIQLEATDKANS